MSAALDQLGRHSVLDRLVAGWLLEYTSANTRREYHRDPRTTERYVHGQGNRPHGAG